MAVKVMLASALAKRDEAPESKPRANGTEPKPKRRRSSVFDADGNEVFITLLCLKCKKVKPLSQFGLRKMADGAIRNQPWCRTCRAAASAENPKRARRDEDGESVIESAAAGAEAMPDAASTAPVDPGSLAAQVVAALHGGRR
jgi:hypothetical protein